MALNFSQHFLQQLSLTPFIYDDGTLYIQDHCRPTHFLERNGKSIGLSRFQLFRDLEQSFLTQNLSHITPKNANESLQDIINHQHVNFREKLLNVDIPLALKNSYVDDAVNSIELPNISGQGLLPKNFAVVDGTMYLLPFLGLNNYCDMELGSFSDMFESYKKGLEKKVDIWGRGQEDYSEILSRSRNLEPIAIEHGRITSFNDTSWLYYDLPAFISEIEGRYYAFDAIPLRLEITFSDQDAQTAHNFVCMDSNVKHPFIYNDNVCQVSELTGDFVPGSPYPMTQNAAFANGVARMLDCTKDVLHSGYRNGVRPYHGIHNFLPLPFTTLSEARAYCTSSQLEGPYRS